MNFDILRQKILEKAIRGELVPQLESEPEVKQIGEAPEDVPFAIPEKWKWLPLNKFSEKRRTVSPNTITGEVELWSIPAYDAGSPEKVNSKHIGSSKKEVVNGDVLLSKIVPNIKRAWIVKSDHPHKLASTEWLTFSGKNILDPEFMRQVFLSPYFRGKMMDTISGMGSLKRANPRILQQTLIPVPHLQEQRRIVTKINQLFEQIDFAEKAYDELSGPLAERFRQLCLEKAIQGKLVPQLESEPEVEQVGDAPEDVPFEIPEKWRWMQLNKVGKIVGGGTPKTSLSEYWDGGTIPWFTPADLGKVHGLYASDSARKITALGLKESSAVMMPPNSVLFSSRAPIGHIALAADSCCTNQGCKSFVPNVGIVLPLWGYFAMKARTPDMIARASGTTFKEISGKGVGETLVPIPPLEEQRRIVTKLSEILNVVRQLENSVLIS